MSCNTWYIKGTGIHHTYIHLLKGFGMLVLFTKLSLMEYLIRCLALFPLLLVIDGFGWFWMGSLHKNIKLMLEFLKSTFLVLHFFCYTFINDHPDDVIFKACVCYFLSNFYFSPNHNPSETMKNVFYFI